MNDGKLTVLSGQDVEAVLEALGYEALLPAQANAFKAYSSDSATAGPLLGRAGVLVVDSIEACSVESGEAVLAGLGPDDMAEIGALLNGQETVHGDISMFNSVGLGIQDLVVARQVLDKATEMGIGSSVPF